MCHPPMSTKQPRGALCRKPFIDPGMTSTTPPPLKYLPRSRPTTKTASAAPSSIEPSWILLLTRPLTTLYPPHHLIQKTRTHLHKPHPRAPPSHTHQQFNCDPSPWNPALPQHDTTDPRHTPTLATCNTQTATTGGPASQPLADP